MLRFSSSQNDIVSSSRAIRSAIEGAVADLDGSCDLLVVHATIGHDFHELVAAAAEALPDAAVVGCSACGVVGNQGASERMRSIAVMAVSGTEFAVASADTIRGSTSFDVAAKVAAELKAQSPDIRMVNILASGIDIAGDQALAGIASVFGPDVPVFGGTSADNMRAAATLQFAGGRVFERGIVLVGFSDPTLELCTAVHHGSRPIGRPFEVTKANGNQIQELDGKPAWPVLMDRVGMAIDTDVSATIPVCALGQKVPDAIAPAYANSHVIHTIFKVADDLQSFYLPASCPTGTQLWQMQRDEMLIFSGTEQMVEGLVQELAGRRPVAVFHTDCGARGKLMFNKILKDEIILKLQFPLTGGEPMPWLGLYGFGEFTPVAGHNHFHTQTSSLYALVRQA